MGNGSVRLAPTTFLGLDNTIYALRSRWIENTLPPSEIPSFGNDHSTFDLLWYAPKGYCPTLQKHIATWEHRQRNEKEEPI